MRIFFLYLVSLISLCGFLHGMEEKKKPFDWEKNARLHALCILENRSYQEAVEFLEIDRYCQHESETKVKILEELKELEAARENRVPTLTALMLDRIIDLIFEKIYKPGSKFYEMFLSNQVPTLEETRFIIFTEIFEKLAELKTPEELTQQIFEKFACLIYKKSGLEEVKKYIIRFSADKQLFFHIIELITAEVVKDIKYHLVEYDDEAIMIYEKRLIALFEACIENTELQNLLKKLTEELEQKIKISVNNLDKWTSTAIEDQLIPPLPVHVGDDPAFMGPYLSLVDTQTNAILAYFQGCHGITIPFDLVKYLIITCEVEYFDSPYGLLTRSLQLA